MSTSASSTTLSSLDHLPPSEQLCYVNCNHCDTVLAVSVPSSSLFKTVTVRCGHCATLLPVNMCGLLLPTSVNELQHHLGHNLFPPPPNQTSVEELSSLNCLMNQCNKTNDVMPYGGRLVNHNHEIPRPTPNNRTPEKRQRVPSAYNRFIKEEIQRIKAGNPDISHREAFSAAAKNWAHFPHIHFGLMSDPTVKKTNMRPQEGEDVMMNNGYFASANVGVSPY